MALARCSLVLCAVVLLTAPTASAGQPASGTREPVRFHSEVIQLFIQPGQLTVDGLYRFVGRAGRSGIPVGLFYPYPRDSLLGAAHTELLAVLAPNGDWMPLAFEELPDGRGVRWRIPFAGDTTLVRTVYRQTLLASYARYIVTSTAAWGRPLEHARFEVCLPDSARAPEFSYPFQRAISGAPCYVYEARSFLPADDIVVTWSRPR